MGRSVFYPFKDLGWCINIVKKYITTNKILTKKDLAIIMGGNGSIISGDFKKKFASLKSYNLIDVKKGSIEFTELAKNIIFSKDEKTKIALLKEATLSTESFKILHDELSSTDRADERYIDSIAVNIIGIQPKALNKFKKNFYKSAKYSKLLEKENRDDITNTKTNNKDKKKVHKLEKDETNTNDLSVKGNDQYTIPFRLESGDIKYIKIPKPSEMNSIDKQRLQNIISLYIKEWN